MWTSGKSQSLCLHFLIKKMQELDHSGGPSVEMGWQENVLSPWKWCAKPCMSVCLRQAGSHLRSGVTSGLKAAPASAVKYCSLNVPGVSPVSPNQFLEGRDLGHRLHTCPSVGVSHSPMGASQHL